MKHYVGLDVSFGTYRGVLSSLDRKEIATIRKTRPLLSIGLPVTLSIMGATQTQAEPAVLSFSNDWNYGITAYFFLACPTA